EGAFKSLRRAGSDGGESLGDALERRQTEAHLKGGDQQEHDRQYPEGDDQRAIEAVGLVVDLGPVARDRDEIAPLLAEVDGALDDPQLLAFGSLGVALPRAA